MLSVSWAGLNIREKLFVMLAWLPKATVQAALAAAPLDRILVSSIAVVHVEHLQASQRLPTQSCSSDHHHSVSTDCETADA